MLPVDWPRTYGSVVFSKKSIHAWIMPKNRRRSGVNKTPKSRTIEKSGPALRAAKTVKQQRQVTNSNTETKNCLTKVRCPAPPLVLATDTRYPTLCGRLVSSHWLSPSSHKNPSPPLTSSSMSRPPGVLIPAFGVFCLLLPRLGVLGLLRFGVFCWLLEGVAPGMLSPFLRFATRRPASIMDWSKVES